MTLIERVVSFDPLRSSLPLDRLSVAAVGYLLLPNLIFLVGWLEPALGLPLCALGVFCFWHFSRAPFSVRLTGPERWAILLILILAASWAAFGGAGHFFFANHDWGVRDAVLGDLAFGDWPVAYENPAGDPLLLRSALGYFLPAALFAKSFGIASVDWALYLWTVAGVTIFLLLLPLPPRPGFLLLACISMVVFYSGMDMLGFWLVHDRLPNFPHAIAWWVPYSYSSLSAQLFWAPNHSLPIWIVTALLYRHWANVAIGRLMLLVLPLSLIWTPFAIAGLMPFVFLAGIAWWKRRKPLEIDAYLLTFAILLSYVSLRFITLDLGGLPIHILGEVAKGTNVSRLATPSLTDYLVFVEIEFGILALALLPTLRHSFGLYGVAVLMLLLLPIISLGPSKDTMLRMSVPPLLVLLILAISNLQDWVKAKSFPASAYVIGIVLLLGVPSAFNEMARAVIRPRVAPDYGRSLIEQQRGSFPAHYVARLNQADLRWLLKTPIIVRSSTQREK